MCLSDDSLTSFVSSSPGANASTVRRLEGLGEELSRLRRGEDMERAKRVSVRLQTEGKISAMPIAARSHSRRSACQLRCHAAVDIRPAPTDDLRRLFDSHGDALRIGEDGFEDGRLHRRANAAVSGVDVDERQVEDGGLYVDLHSLASPERRCASYMVP